MVLMSVDFPRPVWPVHAVSSNSSRVELVMQLTNADDVELESPLDALLLNLLGDAVESDIAVRKDGLCLVRGSHCGRRGPRWQMDAYEKAAEWMSETAGERSGEERCCGEIFRVVATFLWSRRSARERGQPRSGALVARSARRDRAPTGVRAFYFSITTTSL